jgi:signal transduction histidine kinase
MDEGGSLMIRLGSDGAFAEVAFTDTGCGMTPDVLQNIFEPFFTRSRTGKGTGLGLFISHQIVDQHGGQIEAASAGPGHGSTFTVRVPLREAAGSPAQLGAHNPDALLADHEAVLPFPGKKAA